MSDKPITADRVLQTVGGLILTICLGLAGWALNTTQAHEGRIIRLETEVAGSKELLREIRTDIKEIKADLSKKGNP